MITFRSVHCHAGLIYIFNVWHSGTLALRAERQSARMSEIKNLGYTWMAKYNDLTSLPFKQSKVKYTTLCLFCVLFATCSEQKYEMKWNILLSSVHPLVFRDARTISIYFFLLST